MFQEDSYQVVKGVIPGKTCSAVAKSISFLQQKGLLKYGDPQVEKAYSAYGIPVTERLLQSLCPAFSKITDSRLCPTYSYMRVYLRGATLRKHVDRPSCEISVTLAIDADSPTIWPIFIEAKGKTIGVELEPGDALIYEGHNLPHWRDSFDGERQIQVFLHYVREDGPYKEFKFDERSGVGMTPLMDNQLPADS